jgi:quercetin dioxygenase-like cupin family protein
MTRPAEEGRRAVTSRAAATIRRFALGTCAVIVVGAPALGADQVTVRQLSQRDIVEKIDGKSAGVTVKEVIFEPNGKDTPHRHAGPVFGYVLEGEYEHAIDDEPIKTYKAGDTFYEPSGCLHRVAQNPSRTTKTRLLAVILHPRDAAEVTTWDKGKE